MKFSPDDPEITAYALGEITDPTQIKQIEAAVAASPELRAAVDAIRATSAAIKEALAAEPAPELTEAEKARLHPAAITTEPFEDLYEEPRTPAWRICLNIAATLMVLGVLASIFIPTVGRVRDAARRMPERGYSSLEQPQARLEEQAAKSGSDERATANEIIAMTAPSAAAPAEGPPPAPRALDRMERQLYLYESEAPALAATRHPVRGRENKMPIPSDRWNTDAFDPIAEADFRSPSVAPLSTFSIDVDTASYAKVREFLINGQLPPPNAVRIEELINYFPYSDSPPARAPSEGGDPFAVHLEQSVAPWAPAHRLLRINLKGYEVPWADRPPSNLVFLMDVSGSMSGPNRLPLVKKSLRLLVDRLDQRDRVAIVVYAGASGIALPSTTADNKETILHAIERLESGGSTNAGQGIELAYATARDHFIDGGNNRVILCTDGDFNVGVTDRGQLADLVQENADAGVSLTVLGFGMGNYKDNMLEELSEKGKGTYGYIDSEAESRKVFLKEIAANLFTIARDVKIQVEFNPAEVEAYRLIGYENRELRPEQFNDDSARAGDIGPGHTVTAFYEIVPAGVEMNLPDVDPLRYQAATSATADETSGELATVKLRFKRPGEDASQLLVHTVSVETPAAFRDASADFRFGAAVAAFGMRLRNSEHVGGYSWREIRDAAATALGEDAEGYRSDFLQLVNRASRLSDAAGKTENP